MQTLMKQRPSSRAEHHQLLYACSRQRAISGTFSGDSALTTPSVTLSGFRIMTAAPLDPLGLDMADLFDTHPPITNFRGEHFVLSNMSPAPMTIDGHRHPTLEYAFQAAKTISDLEKQMIAAAPDGFAAKRLGKLVTATADWDDRRVQVMRELLAIKFQDPTKAAALIATHPRRLIEGSRGDAFWGMLPNGHGRNMLGFLLMELRDTLRVR